MTKPKPALLVFISRVPARQASWHDNIAKHILPIGKLVVSDDGLP